nr:MAG TPA: hypothetical protein [Caudoviricetes sp.]
MSRVLGNIFIVILHKFSLRFLYSLPIDVNSARSAQVRAAEILSINNFV